MPTADPPDEHLGLISLDARNAFNGTDRQIFVDLVSHNITQVYFYREQENLSMLPRLFNDFVSKIRTLCGRSGSLFANAANDVFHNIESRTGMQQGHVFGDKLHNIGTLSVVVSDMPERRSC